MEPLFLILAIFGTLIGGQLLADFCESYAQTDVAWAPLAALGAVLFRIVEYGVGGLIILILLVSWAGRA